MEISKHQISLFGEDSLMLLPEGSLASHLATQEKERGKQITETSGRIILEQLNKFSHVGPLAKMFLACLVGKGDWSSTKSKLTWKLRGLKSSHHLYFPACSTDKDHQRNRVFFVAYNHSAPTEHEISARWDFITSKIINGSHTEGGGWNSSAQQENGKEEVGQEWGRGLINFINDASNSNGSRQPRSGQPDESINTKKVSKRKSNRPVNDNKQHSTHTDTEGQRLEGAIIKNGGEGPQSNDELFRRCDRERNENWLEAATRLCGLVDGLSGRLDTKTISKTKWRTESLKGFGNAVVPDVVYEIFKVIEMIDKNYVRHGI